MRTCKIIFHFISFIICLSVHAQYIVSTYAGKGSPGSNNGKLSEAEFNGSAGMCFDKSGNIYVADWNNNCIRKISSLGIVSTYAGTIIAGYKDGSAATAQFNQPMNVCADDSGNIFVSDFGNHLIRKVSLSGMVSTFAGSNVAGYSDGFSLDAQFDCPRGICIAKNGDIFIGDSWNHRIRKISKGIVSTYAGGGDYGVSVEGDYIDGDITNARFYTPCGVQIDDSLNVFVADAYNHRIRKIFASGKVITIAGSGITGKGNGGFADGYLSVGRLNTPTELFVTKSGEIFIGDTYNNRVRKLNKLYILSTVAGNGKAGFINGSAEIAEFNFTRGVIVENDSTEKIYVVDNNNNCIRLIESIPSEINELMGLKNLDIKISPNPLMGNENLKIINSIPDNASYSLMNQNTTFYLYDVFGKQIRYIELKGSNSINLNSENLSKGMYFYILRNKGEQIKEGKLVLQ